MENGAAVEKKEAAEVGEARSRGGGNGRGKGCAIIAKESRCVVVVLGCGLRGGASMACNPFVHSCFT